MDREWAELLIGAIHHLTSIEGKNEAPEKIYDDFLATQERFVKSGIAVIAHPFRLFRRAGLEVPATLYPPTVRMLKENGVAAEMNFHCNEPDPAFFRQCLEAGVKLSLGSDAHMLAEIGEFYPHLQLLRTLGVGEADLADILLHLK